MQVLDYLDTINKGLTLKIVSHFKPNVVVKFTAHQYDDFDASIFNKSMQLSSILETKVRTVASTTYLPPAMLIDQSKVERLQYWSKRLEVPSFVTQFYLGDRTSYTFRLSNADGSLVRDLELVEKQAAPHFGDSYRIQKKLYLLPFAQSREWKF
jgi:hypothetical protein